MRPPIIPLVLVALILTPTASAGFSWSPLVEVAAPRVGDQYRYEQSVTVTPASAAEEDYRGTPIVPGQSTILIDVVGPSVAKDSFGVDRAVETFRTRQADSRSLVLGVACHAVPNGAVALRRDFTLSPPDYTWRSGGEGLSAGGTPLYGVEARKDWTPVTRFDPRTCDGDSQWGGMQLNAGDVLHIYATPFAPGLPGIASWVPSAPAVATKFHDRDALSFTWDASTLFSRGPEHVGSITVVLADGLPGPVRVDVDVEQTWDDSTREIRSTTELVGFSQGVGRALDTQGNQQRPKSAPGPFRPYDPLRVDDAPFGFAYPYADAFNAVRSDPSVGLGEYLDTHPDAILVVAIYERQMRTTAYEFASVTEPKQTDGGWLIIFADESSWHGVASVRTTGARTPVADLDAPAKVIENQQVAYTNKQSAPPERPTQLASMDTVLARAEAEGLGRDRLDSFVYLLYDNGRGQALVNVFLSEVPYVFGVGGGDDDVGLFASFALSTGETYSVSTSARQTTTKGLVGGATAIEKGSGGSGAFAALTGPNVGAGLAAGAATGVALLFLLLKFVLLPLFTRLRRDSLLDNPVRARIYERVRSDPGIHLSELVDFAGIGYGATRHHLAQLVHHRMLSELDVDGLSRYYASGEVPPAEARRAALLRSDSTRAVYDLLASEPHLSLREAGARLGLSAPSVHRIKKKLEAAGLLPAASVAAAN